MPMNREHMKPSSAELLTICVLMIAGLDLNWNMYCVIPDQKHRKSLLAGKSSHLLTPGFKVSLVFKKYLRSSMS